MSTKETSDGGGAGTPTGTETGRGKRDWASRVITDIFERIGVSVAVDLKEGADGGLSAALKLEGDLPGVQPGRRSHVLEALQFLVNKIVNRPGVERRWIAIGVGAHPEPRPRRPLVPATAPVARPVTAGPARTNGRPVAPVSRSVADDEAVEPLEDPLLAAAVRTLAERAGKLGRSVAILAMNREDRARTLVAVKGLSGMKAQAEGEGRNRRVVFTPDRPAPAPKRHPHGLEEDLDE